MQQLVGVGQLECRFGPFRDSVAPNVP
jgi:hypothetical protein